MDIEFWRDLIIIILGAIGIVVSVLMALVFYNLYGKLKSLETAVNSMVTTVQTMSMVMNQVIKPIAELAVLFQGIQKIINLFRKGGEKNG